MNCFMCKGDLIDKKVCKQCGEQYFDNDTTEKLDKMVNKLKKLALEVTIVNYDEKVA